LVEEFKTHDIEFSSFCELGLGTGRNVKAFHDEYPDATYCGNDIFPDIKKFVEEQHPEVLDYTDIYIEDTLQFLKKPPCEMDFVFTHGHLMHIPEDVIQEVMKLIFEQANTVAFCEVFHKTFEERDGYRFSRNYTKFFPHNFSIVRNELMDDGKSQYYIGIKK